MPLPATFIGRLRHWLGWPNSHYRTHEKLVAAVGGLLGIVIVWNASLALLGPEFTPLVVPSLGATAVLVFAVPHSPLTQPWAVVGGHVISAVIGVACQLAIPNTVLAGGAAVGLALFAMHALRCIHPPGGATALTAVIGGSAVHALGFRYALTPVAVNGLLIVALGVLYNYAFPWRRYPLALMPSTMPLARPTPGFPRITQAQIEAAMEEQQVVLDVSPEELMRVFEATLARAAAETPTPNIALHLGGIYGNNQPGPAWSVRRLVDERSSPTPEFDLVVYEILEGPGRGRTDSCRRDEFMAWAASEIRPSSIA